MTAIADTSPLRYLVLIDAVWLLPLLFDRVVIPSAVRDEWWHESTPKQVTSWISTPPSWLDVWKETNAPDPALQELDAGEAAVIDLASHFGSPTLLVMDDARGRREAAARRIPVTGTWGVLQAGSRKGLLTLSESLPRLLETNFHVGGTC